jgi:hypothetical protein
VQAAAGWGGAATLRDAFAAVGAFPLSADSADAALLRTLAGAHTAAFHVTSPGLGLIEIYDAGRNASARLVNLSARYPAGAGDAALVAGFVIDGATEKTLLIRGIGPGLGQFGLADALRDPKIEVFDGTARKLAENDDWTPPLGAVFGRVGAFGLPAGSKDAALQLTLPPGLYTARLSGADGGAGEALIEIYEVQ